MKFDPARVVASASEHPADGRSPLDWFADACEASGLRVDRRPRPAWSIGPRAALASAVVLGGAAWLALTAAVGARPRVGWAVALGLDFAALVALVRLTSGRPLPFRRRETVPCVDASADGLHADRPLVIVLVRLATPARPSRGWRRWGGVAGLIAAAVLIEAAAPRPLATTGLAAVSIGLAGAVALIGRSGPAGGENRTGIALLAELARTWPPSARARAEAHFVAIGGPFQTLSEVAGRRPYLLVEIGNPGIPLRIGGSPEGRALALAAARDLWIPSEESRLPESPPVVEDGPLLHLVIGAPGHAGPKSVHDPEALGRAAQLVVELALRRARGVGA